MTAFFVALWITITSFLGFDTRVIEQNISEVNSSQQAPPSGTPKQSAPLQAVESCTEKQIDDSCTFILGTQEITGNCADSGGELACAPVFPK